MAIDYASMDQVARRLIRENGVTATLRRNTELAYDPVTDAETKQEDTYAINVVLLPVRDRDRDFDIERIYKTSGEIRKLTKMLVSTEGLPTGFAIMPDDEIEVQAEVWRVGGNNIVRPNNDPILHACYAFQ